MLARILKYFAVFITMFLIIYFAMGIVQSAALSFCRACTVIDTSFENYSSLLIRFAAIYSVVSLGLNLRNLKGVHRFDLLLMYSILDILIIPIIMCVIVFYYQFKGITTFQATDFLYIWIFIIGILAKHIIINLMDKFKDKTVEKHKSTNT